MMGRSRESGNGGFPDDPPPLYGAWTNRFAVLIMRLLAE